uniref:Uncharacterized protein n=1 Tax=Arundo donax TaxID=35708 RepID=A0A0A9CCF5_ARUDO
MGSPNLACFNCQCLFADGFRFRWGNGDAHR